MPPLQEVSGEQLKDEAIDRVGEAADPEWMDAAHSAAMQLVNTRHEFTTDDVWALIPPGMSTPEPRAMGAVMRALARSGFVRNSQRTARSTRPECHRRPLTIWVSLL